MRVKTVNSEPPERDAIYKIFRPKPGILSLPVLFNSPHSGRQFPSAFLSQTQLDLLKLRKSEDAFVDELIDFVPELGGALMTAQFPRSFLDVNREAYELDPKLFEGKLPAYARTNTLRVQNGFGTIPRIVADQEYIYQNRISIESGLERIHNYYMPYHDKLNTLLGELIEGWRFTLLVDCHSMPSSTVSGYFGKSSDIVIGNRFGKSCSADISSRIRYYFKELGYRVSMNKPYAGGYNTEHYGKPMMGMQAIQIEINRGLYMNEFQIEKTNGFHQFKKDLRRILEKLCVYIEATAKDNLANAAE